MNFQKFTQKSIEAVNSAQSIATEHGNQEITELHLFCALLKQENGLIGGLIQKITPQFNSLLAEIENAINTLPKVSGASQKYISNDLNLALEEAEKHSYLEIVFLDDEKLVINSDLYLMEAGQTAIEEYKKQKSSSAKSTWAIIISILSLIVSAIAIILKI